MRQRDGKGGGGSSDAGFANLLLERVRLGMAAVSGDGTVLTANGGFRGLVGSGRGLVLGRDNRVAAAVPEQTILLRRAIAAACEGDGARCVVVRGPEQRRPLIARVEKLTEWPQSGPIAAMFVSDPGWPVELEAPLVATLFQLTAAEARLAEALAKGMTLDEVAAACSISKCTVRAQLRQVFAKTGTCRQAQVVRLILSSALHMVALRHDDAEQVPSPRHTP